MTSLFGANAQLNVNASGTLVPQAFTPTDGQTVFTITAFNYTINTNSLLVFINGIKQRSGVHFTETSSSSFTLSSPVTSVDLVEIIGFPLSDISQVADLTGPTGASRVGFDTFTVASYFTSKVNRVVDSIAELRTLDKTKYTRAFVTGYYAAADGGGGAYNYDSTDVASADNGGTIIVAADGARWKLCETKELSVKQFGAKGDGSNNDKIAIQNTINVGKAVYIPYSAGGYKVNSRITCPAGTKIRGDWKKTTIVAGFTGDYIFEITGSEVVIEGLKFDCSITGGCGIFLLRSDSTSMERIYIRDIESSGATTFIADVFHASNIIVLLQLQRCISRLARGNAVDLRQVFAYMLIEDVTIDYVGSASRNFQAFQVRNNQGSVWTRVDVTGGLVDATTTSNDAFFFASCVAVWMTDCMADTCGGNGYYLFGSCHGFYFNNCVASLNGKAQFALGSSGGTSYDLVLTGCSAFGRRGQTYSPSFAGYQLDATNKAQLTGCKSQDNVGAGYFSAAATRTTISGGRSDSNTGRGFDSSGTGSCLISGMGFDSNTAGNANLSSANMLLSNCQSSAGALFSITGPGSA